MGGAGSSQDPADQSAALRPTIVCEAGDGDCLFHCIARQCLGDPSRSPQARQEICDWMEQHVLPHVVRAGVCPISAAHLQEIRTTLGDIFNVDGEDVDALAYIQRMRHPREWGSGFEALCAGYLYRRSVHIWRNQAESPESGESPTVSIKPPCVEDAEDQQVGLIHTGTNHWNSVLLPPGWHPETAPAYTVRPAPRQTAAERVDDIALQTESMPEVRHDPSLTDEQRRLQRERIAARYETCAPKRAVAPKRSAAAQRSFARRQQEAGASGSRQPVGVQVAEQRCTPQVEQRQPDPEAAVEARCRQCVEALVRVGLSEHEALEALTAANGDVDIVKAMYCVDWDAGTGQTVQTWFAET